MKNKRRYIYQKLAKLKRALKDPRKYLMDPNLKKLKNKRDRSRRIRKKIKKSRETFRHKHEKRCINCKKYGHLVKECPNIG